MRKLIAVMNLTIDGFCDHTAMIADEEIHQHYTELLRGSDAVIYGRITYQLMCYWKSVLENPTGNKADDDFAAAIDDISKIVYSQTLADANWRNTELKREILKDEILKLKEESGNHILVGSPSLIVQLGNLGLIDEYQLSVQPIVLGRGVALFTNISNRVDLKLLNTKIFGCGAVTHYYEPTNAVGSR